MTLVGTTECRENTSETRLLLLLGVGLGNCRIRSIAYARRRHGSRSATSATDWRICRLRGNLVFEDQSELLQCDQVDGNVGEKADSTYR